MEHGFTCRILVLMKFVVELPDVPKAHTSGVLYLIKCGEPIELQKFGLSTRPSVRTTLHTLARGRGGVNTNHRLKAASKDPRKQNDDIQ